MALQTGAARVLSVRACRSASAMATLRISLLFVACVSLSVVGGATTTRADLVGRLETIPRLGRGSHVPHASSHTDASKAGLGTSRPFMNAPAMTRRDWVNHTIQRNPTHGASNGNTWTTISPSHVRGTWIDVHTGCTSEPECLQTMGTLFTAGINTVFVDVWNNGETYFHNSKLPTTADHLGWAVQGAAAYNISVVAWFEYGLMAGYGCENTFCREAKANGWLISGQPSDGFQWMNASNSDVLHFLSAILKDAISNYPTISGVQLDDHFAQPAALVGHDPGLMTAAARSVATDVGSPAKLMLSPATLPFALDTLNVDWASWEKAGLFSMYSPQLYTASVDTFQAELAQTLLTVPPNVLSVGVRINGTGGATPMPAATKMMKLAASKQVGAIVWYVSAVLADPTAIRQGW